MVDLPVIERREPLPPELLRYGAFEYSVERKHCVDAMGPDSEGSLEYHYDYTTFRFLSEGASLSGRQYKDSPSEAHFLSISNGENPRLIEVEDFQLPLLRAQSHTLKSEG